MENNIYKKLSTKFHKYKISKIESGASKKIFYKLVGEKKENFLVIDFNKDKSEYKNHLKIYDILKNINISVPNIIEKNYNDLTLICEYFGDKRFDKILNQYSIKDLLEYAVDSLIEIKNSTNYDKSLQLEKYDFTMFNKEIAELPDYYFSHIGLHNQDLKEEFLSTWSYAFKKINFDFENFVHKDFNLNNLILIPSRKKHLKCGIIDFQNAFWGDASWDLFSLLEDSRIIFTDEFNEEFIDYFFSRTSLNTTLSDFKMKFYFLNFSRQSRLLGRWIKLSKNLNKDWYLNFIPTTKKRLKKNIDLINDINLKKFYKRYIIN